MGSNLDFTKYYKLFRGLTSHDSPLEKKVHVDHILGGARDRINGNDGSSYGGNGSNGTNGTSATNIFLRLSGTSSQFRITGTVQKVWDLSEDGYINLNASGGDGGRGGDGHVGRRGIDGSRGYAGRDGSAGCPGGNGSNGGPGGNGTDGGPGGHGANGGNGGNGGLIVVESTNPWLFLFVQAKAVKGQCGRAGRGGSGGAGGPGGSGGIGLSRSYYVNQGNGQGYTKTDYYPSGSSGYNGSRGYDGSRGSDGRSGSAGRNGEDGSILFSHIDEHGNILQISTNPFDLVLHHFQLFEIFPDQIIEPVEQVFLTNFKIENKGDMVIPEGTVIEMGCVHLLNTDRVAVAQRLLPGYTDTITTRLNSQVCDFQEPTKPSDTPFSLETVVSFQL
jgi:hypothetical protein